jgi:2-amino-4-hydroxy-6-hydroxymethyldihydropteridine diphosphokinase
MTDAVVAYVGLGSNLNNPLTQLHTAYKAIGKLPDSHLGDISNIYQSQAIGPQGQPDYLNAVVSLHTRLKPEQLLLELQEIENQQGRKRELRWGARTLDLDIILYGDLLIDTPLLTVPHKEMLRRNFVLLPLFDLNPDLMLPDGQALGASVETTNSNDITLAYSTEAFISTCS